MRHEGTLEVFRYWDRLRGTRRAPQRTEIEPADIRRRLADTFILEGSGASDAVFRLAGTRICANHGCELKGVSYLSLWRPDDRGMVARLLRAVFNEASVVVGLYEGSNDQGRRAAFEFLLVPLAGPSEERRLLGSTFAIDRAYWMGAYPIVDCALQNVRLVDPERDPLLLKNRPAVDLPERRTSSGHLQAAASPVNSYRRVGHLAVFDGGKKRG